MESNTVQQEILLLVNSSLSKRNFCEKDTYQACRYLTTIEKLEEACWSGLLEEFMPGLLETTEQGKKLFLWQIQRTRQFLHIDLCEKPVFEGKEYSIDPYFFLCYCNYN
jgi:hypothetical protein